LLLLKALLHFDKLCRHSLLKRHETSILRLGGCELVSHSLQLRLQLSDTLTVSLQPSHVKTEETYIASNGVLWNRTDSSWLGEATAELGVMKAA